MPWVFLLLAMLVLAVAFKTASMALMVLCLLGALGLFVAGTMALLARRIDSRSQDASMMIDPLELHRLREQAQARRAAAAQAAEPPESPASQ